MELHFPDEIDATVFLRDYWQKKPLLIRGALSDYRCPLSPEELAGLACEEEIESRIVLEKGGTRPWEVRRGPFDADAFTRLPPSHWTLLVQDVDKHLPATTALLEAFRFLPDWRLDDIMISYAADQGSVGPHVDEYDVFLLQASGRRRWRIHTSPVSEQEYIPGLELRILPEFQPEQEWLLEPPDLLYLPPNIAHWGTAEGDNCITCSIGFRAPTLPEMASAWFDAIIQHSATRGQYRDTVVTPQNHPGEITNQAMGHAQRLVDEFLHREAADRGRWFGCFMTEPKAHLQVEPRSTPLTLEQFVQALGDCGCLTRNGWSRLAFFRGTEDQDYLFVNGEEIPLTKRLCGLLETITDHRQPTHGALAQWLEDPDAAGLLARLYNEGHFLFPDE